MDEIKIAVTGRVATVVDMPEVVADNAEYAVSFAVDPQDGWDMASPITVLFVRRDGKYSAVVMAAGETECVMPPARGTTMVFAGLTQDEMRTTTPAQIPVRRSVRNLTDFPPPPNKDVYAQILAAFAGKANKSEIPSVPSWAMTATKPTYTAAEVGALPSTTVIPDVSGKVDKQQGTANAGKILGVGDDGVVVPTPKPVQALAGAAAPTTTTVGVVGQEYYVIVDNAVTEMYVCTSALIGSYTWDKVEFGGGSYILPTASSTTLGGVKPIAKTDAMTQGVGVDNTGALWTAAGGTWELINEITLTEAVNNVLINTDVNGQPFSLKAVKVECVIKTDTSDPFTFIKIKVNDAQVGTNSTNKKTDETLYFSFLAYAMGESGIMSARLNQVSNNNYNWVYTVEKMGYKSNVSVDYLQSTITKLNVAANDGGKAVGVAGTKIYVYGVKA